MEKLILKEFLFRKEIKFSELEKKLKVRSNKLAYHLKKLTNKGILTKDNLNYKLSENYEGIIPYLSEKNSVLPVVLINIGNKNNCFLVKRNKRPFKEKLGLPGGRILVGENIETAVKRIMKEKHNLNAELIKVHSISLEHVKTASKVIHSFMLVLVSAESKDEIVLTNIEKNKENIIPSDYKLLKNHLNLQTKVISLTTKQ